MRVCDQIPLVLFMGFQWNMAMDWLQIQSTSAKFVVSDDITLRRRPNGNFKVPKKTSSNTRLVGAELYHTIPTVWVNCSSSLMTRRLVVM